MKKNNVIEVARLLKYITWLVDLPNDRNKCMWWLWQKHNILSGRTTLQEKNLRKGHPFSFEKIN